ncbi:Uncharacterized protein HZ326_0071 [Fusarium oxysporum f. sp. albedinis]|nr:Uncharacterized protein HZ326_0071 [Fusarium oxysporum f. sp. albedinis]
MCSKLASWARSAKMALSGNDRSKKGSDDLHLDELFSSHEEQRHRKERMKSSAVSFSIEERPRRSSTVPAFTRISPPANAGSVLKLPPGVPKPGGPFL